MGIKSTEQIAKPFPSATDKVVFQLAEGTFEKLTFKIRYKGRPHHI